MFRPHVGFLQRKYCCRILLDILYGYGIYYYIITLLPYYYPITSYGIRILTHTLLILAHIAEVISLTLQKKGSRYCKGNAW